MAQCKRLQVIATFSLLFVFQGAVQENNILSFQEKPSISTEKLSTYDNDLLLELYSNELSELVTKNLLLKKKVATLKDSYPPKGKSTVRLM